MQVLLIRHAQSQNNATANRLSDEMQGRPKAEVAEAFERERVPEPHLSEIGQKQAQAMGEYIAKQIEANTLLLRRKTETVLRTVQGNGSAAVKHEEFPVFCSPMRRSMLTGQALADNVPCSQLYLHEEIFEVGGSYHQVDGKFVGVNGRQTKEIKAEFPRFHVSNRLSQRGLWWVEAQGRESHKAATQRVRKVIDWLWDIAEGKISASHGYPVDSKTDDASRSGNFTPPATIALVVHGDFLDLFLKTLLNIPEGSTSRFLHCNTGVTAIDFHLMPPRSSASSPDSGTASSRGLAQLLYLNSVDHLRVSKELVTGDEMLWVLC